MVRPKTRRPEDRLANSPGTAGLGAAQASDTSLVAQRHDRGSDAEAVGRAAHRHLSFSVPRDLRCRDQAAAQVHGFCSPFLHEQTRPELGYHVLSAFMEAFNNLVLHSEGDPGPVVVDLSTGPGMLVMELKDTGKSFDFERISSNCLVGLPEGGMGLHIIRGCMSRVEYHPGGNGHENVLRMVKHLDHPDGFADRTQTEASSNA